MAKSMLMGKTHHHKQRINPLDQALMHWEYDHQSQQTPHTDIASWQIGGITVSHLKGEPVKGYRSGEKMQGHEAQIGIVFNMGGAERHFRQGHESVFLAGDINIWRSDLELSFEVNEHAERLIILVPEHRFEPYLDSPLHLPCVWNNPFSSAQGAILQSLFTALAQNLNRIDSQSTECVLESCLALLARSEMVNQKKANPLNSSLYHRILQFIDRHLERDLTPQSIAAAHQISVRYLHLIFAKEGITVSAWIREQRLLRCRDELQHRSQAMNLTELAYRWHFSDSAHFSRLFKQRFGVSPKYWRNAHHVEMQKS